MRLTSHLAQISVLSDFSTPNNAPLFMSNGNNLYLRSNIDNRSLAAYEAYSISDMP